MQQARNRWRDCYPGACGKQVYDNGTVTTYADGPLICLNDYPSQPRTAAHERIIAGFNRGQHYKGHQGILTKKTRKTVTFSTKKNLQRFVRKFSGLKLCAKRWRSQKISDPKTPAILFFLEGAMFAARRKMEYDPLKTTTPTISTLCTAATRPAATILLSLGW